MALIKCVECGKQISDSAEACPNCGKKLTEEDIEHGRQLMIQEQERIEQEKIQEAQRQEQLKWEQHEEAKRRKEADAVFHTSLKGSVSNIGGIACLFSVLIPIVGFILGIVAIVQGYVKRGATAIILSIIMSAFWYSFINWATHGKFFH